MPNSSANEDRRSIRFAEDVGPDSTVIETYEAPHDLTVEQLTVRIYRGAELDLQVFPFVDRDRSDDRQQREPLVVFRGKEFIDGDGDTFEFPVSVSVKEGQEIGVEVENVDSTYTYDFAAEVTVDPVGGLQRSTTSFLGGLF